jgi:hypothetical protein
MNESTIADLTSNVSRCEVEQMTMKTEIVSSGYDIADKV